ncbi:MAG: hypothetical protein FWC20_04825 [Oscillospiraceae bacterium]|nr:hypothetical protein [Oscillospiraceae bacterium]MCL2278717.1 hypothetical protein [Oscillospiraceae bacterium]
MLDAQHLTALKIISDRLSGKGIVWALTGSTSFNLQGMLLSPADIDIQTSEFGAYAINGYFKDYEIASVSFSSTEKIRSHFGRFEINGVPVEVMGDIQKKYNGEWEDIIDISPLVEHVFCDGMTVPVLSLSYESSAYRKMGRHDRADAIDKFLSQK